MRNYEVENYRSEEDLSNLQSNFEREDAYIRAKKRVDKIKGFYWHLFWYLLVNCFLLVMIYSKLDANETFWQYKHFSTVFFWGIGLGFHFLGTFGTNILFGKQWEKKQIKKYLDRDSRTWE